MSKPARVVRPMGQSRSEALMHPDQKDALRVPISRFGALIPVLVAWTTGCLDSSGPRQTPVDSLPNIVGLTVSAPVPGPAAAPSAQASIAGASVNESVVYVSLAPGSVPTGTLATVRNQTTGQSVTTAVVNGGFDPVAIAASVGDTLIVEVRGPSTDVIRAVQVVAAPRPPVVVRTDPPPRKTDVPLNAIMVIVFSAPIDATTLTTASVQLWRGTTPVPGTVRFADVEHLRVEFDPDSLLAAEADYELVVSQGIRDVSGEALDAAVTVPFTTGTTPPATGLVFASVSAGYSHACGVTTTGAAYCWGDNLTGAFGDGSTASSTTPVPVAGGLTFTTVRAGYGYTCGVTTDGAVYCWGNPQFRMVNLPFDNVPSTTPVPVASGFTTVSLGTYHVCGLTYGFAVCWGEDSWGQLGDGPAPGVTGVAGAGAFAAVSAGGVISCGVTPTGAAYCWGRNDLGQLGVGTTTGPESEPCLYGTACSTVPVAVTGGLTFAQVEAKGFAACGLTTSGTAYCWGDNANDRLGLGTDAGPCAPAGCDVQPSPVAVPGVSDLVSLSGAEWYTCGLSSTGAAYCWGYKPYVYDGPTTPVAVPGGLTFKSLSAGFMATCGVTAAGVAYCWGINDRGTLGDGTTTSSTVPVKVAGQPR